MVRTCGESRLMVAVWCFSLLVVRGRDLVCRYGGDEFAVILNDTSAASAAPLLERFLERARAIEVPGADGTTITCSVGYAEIREGDDSAAFIDRADQALYAAKAAGRDRAIADREE